MYQELFAQSHSVFLPLLGMGLFVFSFAAILIWVVFGLRNSSMPGYMASLPLSDGNGRQEGPSNG